MMRKLCSSSTNVRGDNNEIQDHSLNFLMKSHLSIKRGVSRKHLSNSCKIPHGTPPSILSEPQTISSTISNHLQNFSEKTGNPS